MLRLTSTTSTLAPTTSTDQLLGCENPLSDGQNKMLDGLHSCNYIGVSTPRYWVRNPTNHYILWSVLVGRSTSRKRLRSGSVASDIIRDRS